VVKRSKGNNASINKSSSYRILIVDDDPDILTILKTGLEQNGYAAVDVYDDPELELSNFTASSYDLLLLDIRMPKMDGFELYRKIEKLDNKVKVCFVTAYEVYYSTLKKDFPGLDVKCFVKKPIQIQN
jgi:two-component system, OmpR family, response regulator ChvI